MFNSYYSASSALGVMSVLAIISVIIAVAGGILLYFLFLSPKNQGKFTGFLGWMYDFLSFKKLVLNTVSVSYTHLTSQERNLVEA